MLQPSKENAGHPPVNGKRPYCAPPHPKLQQNLGKVSLAAVSQYIPLAVVKGTELAAPKLNSKLNRQCLSIKQ